MARPIGAGVGPAAAHRASGGFRRYRRAAWLKLTPLARIGGEFAVGAIIDAAALVAAARDRRRAAAPAAACRPRRGFFMFWSAVVNVVVRR
jgi:hypothetical protein